MGKLPCFCIKVGINKIKDTTYKVQDLSPSLSHPTFSQIVNMVRVGH